jgi:hypothetical protein
MNILKDIVIPLASPLIAVVTLLLFLRQELAKVKIQREFKFDSLVKSIYIDLQYLRDMYQMYGLELKTNHAPSPGREDEIIAIAKRIYRKFFEEPGNFFQYFSMVEYNTPDNNLFLLLGEFKIRIDTLKGKNKFDDFILFSIYTLLYLYEEDGNLSEEHLKVINTIRESNSKLYSGFIVKKRKQANTKKSRMPWQRR